MPSGAEPVVLAGSAMRGLVHAVAALGDAGLRRYAIVGGVAVTARLGHAHRATVDVDTVVDETTPPDAVEALLARRDTEADPQQLHRVYVAGTKVEVLKFGPVTDEDIEGIPDDNNALFVASHTWALDTATPLTVVAASDPTVRASAPFATAGALVAMKLHAIETRSIAGLDKRGGDAWDIYRLLVELDGAGDVRAELALAPAPLRRLVAAAADRVLSTGANRTVGWLRTADRDDVTAEELRFLSAPLLASIR